jgi:hypothetical protein
LSITTSADTALTVTVPVAVFDTAPWPSATVYRNVSVPVNTALGVYVTEPLPLGTAVPLTGEVTIATDAALIPTSSVSLATTLIVTGVPFAVVAVSFTATGGWFTPPPTLTNRTASAHVLTVDPETALMVTRPVPLK